MHPNTTKAVQVYLAWDRAERPESFWRILASFLINDVFALWNEHGYSVVDVNEFRPDLITALGDIAALRAYAVISARHAKEILLAIWNLPYLCVIDYIVESKILEEVGGDELEALVVAVMEANPKAVQQIRDGKLNTIAFLVGQSMKAAKGKADPSRIRKIVEAKI